MYRGTIDLGARRVDYEWSYSDRARWVRAEIALRKGLRVVVPRRTPAEQVDRFLKSKARWILRHLDRVERLSRVIPDRRLEHGAVIPFLGGGLTLDVSTGKSKAGRLGDSLLVSVRTPTEASLRRSIVAWYRAAGREELERRVRILAERHGLTYRSVTVRSQKTLWGSCSRAGRLSFNWRLMLAPLEIVDYIICHELSHLTVHNHSAKFWNRVGQLCPGYRQHEAWLRQNQLGLVL